MMRGEEDEHTVMKQVNQRGGVKTGNDIYRTQGHMKGMRHGEKTRSYVKEKKQERRGGRRK